MYVFAFFPRSVPCATLCRKMLPVEMCGTPRYAASFAAWVPLPAPGGPRRTSLMSRRERSQRSKDFGTPWVGGQTLSGRDEFVDGLPLLRDLGESFQFGHSIHRI